MRVDFQVAGVQRAATTALHAYLSEHPQVFMPAQKELHYFDNEDDVSWSDPDYSAYHRHYASARPGLVVGEATPIYTYWPTSIVRIERYNPDTRLIISLRDPVRRAYSHWAMEASRGRETADFSTAIREGRGRVTEDERSFLGCHRLYSYVERGFYAPQIRRVLKHFPHEQVHFVTVDQFDADLSRALGEICAFLRIAAYADCPESRVVQPTQMRDDLAPISARDETYLHGLFRNDIAETASLTGLDLSTWLVGQ